VGNSFNFYARQFGGERIGQMLVSAQEGAQDLFNALETELKIKLRRVSPVVTMEALSQSNDMDTVYAMGACVEPPIASLLGFNFLEDRLPKSKFQSVFIAFLKSYKEIIFVFLICVVSLVGVNVFFQVQLKIAQQQYDRLSSRQGAFLNTPVAVLQAELQQNTDKLTAYKNIKTKSDVVLILLRVASHLPQGTLLKELHVSYNRLDPNDGHVAIDMKGEVFGEDLNGQIAVASQIFSDLKNDKELSRFIKNVDLISLNRENLNGRQATEFNIHCY
jgi:hypothetical protein